MAAIPEGARITQHISQYKDKERLNIVLEDGTPKTLKKKDGEWVGKQRRKSEKPNG